MLRSALPAPCCPIRLFAFCLMIWPGEWRPSEAQWNAQSPAYPCLQGIHRDAHTQPVVNLGVAPGKLLSA